MDINHSVTKNDKKEITGYALSALAVSLGTAVKDEKGNFAFSPAPGVLGDPPTVTIGPSKTMRDLKVALAKALPSDFEAKNKAAAPAPKSTTTGAAGKPSSSEKKAQSQATEVPKAEGDDVNLD